MDAIQDTTTVMQYDQSFENIASKVNIKEDTLSHEWMSSWFQLESYEANSIWIK